MTAPAALLTTYLMSFEVEVGQALSIDQSAPGRRFIPILGGSVSGRLTGRICEGGGDWQTVSADGSIELEAHYIVDINGHGLVEVRSTGLRSASPEVAQAVSRGEEVDPRRVYFRTMMRFRTQANDLTWLNTRLCLSTGRREASRVRLDIHELA